MKVPPVPPSNYGSPNDNARDKALAIAGELPFELQQVSDYLKNNPNGEHPEIFQLLTKTINHLLDELQPLLPPGSAAAMGLNYTKESVNSLILDEQLHNQNLVQIDLDGTNQQVNLLIDAVTRWM